MTNSLLATETENISLCITTSTLTNAHTLRQVSKQVGKESDREVNNHNAHSILPIIKMINEKKKKKIKVI